MGASFLKDRTPKNGCGVPLGLPLKPTNKGCQLKKRTDHGKLLQTREGFPVDRFDLSSAHVDRHGADYQGQQVPLEETLALATHRPEHQRGDPKIGSPIGAREKHPNPLDEATSECQLQNQRMKYRLSFPLVDLT